MRVNFTRRTIDILGKRVGFLCSNPDCRKHTIGPNAEEDKSTTIGIAAHITAAAFNGPRYDQDLSDEQRSHISNGIWLCSNCATLIDKNPLEYSVEHLKKWKRDTEAELAAYLKGQKKVVEEPNYESNKEMLNLPFLEADIIWVHGGRWNRGYSPKNKQPIIIGEDDPIIFWDLDWNFNITLYNNSQYDAYNVSIESVGKTHFDELTSLNKINTLPSLQNIDLDAKLRERIEGTYIEADKLIQEKIPKTMNGLCLKIAYQDESRKGIHSTFAYLENGQFTNKKNA